jgi:ketosteroid isomerase-like protein
VSRENVEMIADALGRFAMTGEPAWDLIAEDVEVYDHDIMDASDYRGHAGFGRWLQDWSAAWSEYSVEPEEFLDAGERVVALIRQRTTGGGSGVALEREDAMVFGMRDGKIARVDYYNDRAEAIKDAGLAP